MQTAVTSQFNDFQEWKIKLAESLNIPRNDSSSRIDKR